MVLSAQIILVKKFQLIIFKVYILILKYNFEKWHDEFLKWDPADHKNQTKIVFSARDIWTPGIVLIIIIKLTK